MNPVPNFALATTASFEMRPLPLEATPKRRQAPCSMATSGGRPRRTRRRPYVPRQPFLRPFPGPEDL